MEKSNTKVVTNASSGYGYKYASLADLARADINIPKMRVKPTEFGEFIEYLDSDGNWQTGAKIVEFEAKGMNHAQMYGAALTYARRYTVQMAESVACDDDDEVEKAKPVNKPRQKTTRTAQTAHGASEKQLNYLRALYKQGGVPEEEIDRYMNAAAAQSSQAVSQAIDKMKAKLDAKSDDILPTEDEV